MADRPLIIFPRPITAPRKKRKGGFSKKPKEPAAVFALEPQVRRLGPKFERLKAQRLELQNHPHGIIPEQVLVLEIRGSGQDFKGTLKKKGLEWLAEEEIDDDILGEEEDSEIQQHTVRKYMRMTDQQAINQLLSLWEKFRGRKSLPRAWQEFFQHLHDLRKWDVEDRLTETGLVEDWKARLAQGETTPVPFEAELWFAQETEQRQKNASSLQQLIEEQGGKVVTQTILPDIAYHALLGELPMPVIQTIISNVSRHTVKLFYCEQVMFFRPVGQCAVRIPEGEEVIDGRISPESTLPPSSTTPVVALLDGLPLQNHQLLRGRLIVEDPDDWATDYPAQSRFHGTAMASLIIHGDLETADVPLTRPIYVRPILKPTGWGSDRQEEAIPENLLPVDLVYRTVRRLFEGEGTEPPVAPEVRIINLSVCDRSRLFHHRLSPWAQLLDWLACKYQVLFIVSAGNHTKDLTLDMPRQSFSFDEIEKQTLRSIAKDTRHRRLLSPSESINALTVGAIHQDNSQKMRGGHLVDPYLTKGLPSPINAHGLGYRRAVKPDILLAGGRQLFAEKLGNSHKQATLSIRNLTSPPGQKVAVPSKQPGVLNGTAYTRGTSNAAALATRVAAQCYELLEGLRSTQPNGELLEKQYDAVLLKALLVHGADWGPVYPILAEALKEEVAKRQLREYMSRFLGYGAVNTQTVFSCTEQRATLLGCGTLREDEAQVYQVPLPFSLSGPKVKRRLTITLAWFTPINPSQKKYRRAHLWFEPLSENPLKVKREQADSRATQRGTVQHEILEGDKAVAFEEQQQLAVQVNCRADAGKLDEPVRYALVVTLAVAEGINLPIYEEIRTRILQAQVVKIKV